MEHNRKSPPEIIRFIWAGIKKLSIDKKPTTAKSLTVFLPDYMNITEEQLKIYLNQSVEERVLQQDDYTKRRSSLSKKTIHYQIPKQNVVQNVKYDWYCYGCHTGGDVVNCSNCLRVFHASCATVVADNSFLATSVESATPTQVSFTSSTSSTSPYIFVDDDSDSLSFIKSENLKVERSSSDHELKPKLADVEFISVVRQPNLRKKRGEKELKNESVSINLSGAQDNIENVSSNALCKHCIVMKTSNSNQIPNMSVEELNCLITYLFDDIKTWLPDNTFAPLSPSEHKVPFLSKHLLELFKNLFFKFPMSVDTINQRLRERYYNSLDEYYCDILDLQHCIGIMHGVASEEYEAVKCINKDSKFNISEIRVCPDCYKHSHEKDRLWFTKSCTIRHELVFAKQTGFSYWPAKVLKVVDKEYDVRFFGGRHNRALINSTNIKPIDTNLEELKLPKKLLSFNKAMEELEAYKQNVRFNISMEIENSASNDVVHDAVGIENILLNETYNSNVDSSKKRGRPRKLIVLLNTIGHTQKDTSETDSIPKSSTTVLRKRKRRHENNNESLNCGELLFSKQNRKDLSDIPPTLIRQMSATRANTKTHPTDANCIKFMDRVKQKIDKISDITEESREQLIYAVESEFEIVHKDMKNIIEGISEAKRTQWCYVCDEIGEYHCCWNTFYCSVDCQMKDWLIHKYECKRK